MQGQYLQIVYISRQTHRISEPDLLDIQKKIVNRSVSKDISGVLLHRSGIFLHFIEGPYKATVELLVDLATDPNHRDMRLVIVHSTPKRHARFWSMGVIDMNHSSDNDAFSSLIKTASELCPSGSSDSEVESFLDRLITYFAGHIESLRDDQAA